MEELRPQEDWILRHFYTAIALLGTPHSMLDVGCGFGWLPYYAIQVGVDAYGVDQLCSVNGKGYLFHKNLVEKFDLGEQVEMVWCTEVAEHLDPSAHSTLCDTLADNLKEGRGNYLVFSSAFPNQGGNVHVSERPSKYWLDQFAMRDLGFRKDLTVSLSLLWSNINSPLYWLACNVMVFEK